MCIAKNTNTEQKNNNKKGDVAKLYKCSIYGTIKTWVKTFRAIQLPHNEKPRSQITTKQKTIFLYHAIHDRCLKKRNNTKECVFV